MLDAGTVRQVAAKAADALDSDVTLVVGLGAASMDLYSQRLAEHLRVPKLFTDAYATTANLFNVPLVSAASAAAIRRDAAFVRRLREVDGPLHLTNHHFGRYGHFLSVPHAVTLHDVIRHLDQASVRPLIHAPNVRDRIYLRLDYAGIRTADAVIAVSETTKRDAVKHLAIDESKVFVVYEGVDHETFRPVPGRPLDAPYILYVGSEHPRKNLATLLAAFARVKEDGRFRDLKLVKIGRAGGSEAPFRERSLRAVRELGVEGDVVFTEHVDDAVLAGYYSAAECFVLPSLYEGFGLPPLEAMACGCPVVVSNRGALPEIAGDAAIVVDPLDVAALAETLRALLAGDAGRKELAERGRRRALEFSWERAARETLAVYRMLESL